MAPDRRTDQNNTNLAEDRLWELKQNGCPLERYVEEFLELSYEVSCPETSLCVYFWMGLDKDTIRYCEPICYFFQVESINLILYLNGSSFEVKEVKVKKSPPHPAPSETHKVSPAHLEPVPSAYPSNGSVHFCPPAIPHVLNSVMKMAATPESCRKMAATPEPCRKMAATPEPSVKMAAAPA